MTDTAKLQSVKASAAGYNDLKFYFSNLNTMFSIRDTLAIDMMTSMPQGGLTRRIHEISSLTKRIYAETTTPSVSKLLDQVEGEAQENSDNWDEWDSANLTEMRRIHSHLSALPPELYIASVQISNEGRKMHQAAQSAKNWDEVSPYIEKVVDTYRRIGEFKQQKFNTETPYRALLIGYASDIDDRQMDDMYDALLKPLQDLYQKALDKQNMDGLPKPIEGKFSRGDQMWLNKTVLELLGFDFTRGCLEITNLSPMMGGHYNDTRILVRCKDGGNFMDSLEDTLYQGARGLYQQNLPEAWHSQPVGQDQGMIMMNTLSALYETIIGRTPQFFDFISTRAEGVFRQFKNSSFEPENFYKLKKILKRKTTRNDADEFSKIFHDILRYRIERDLINGKLAVKDLPERWNAESKELLGMTPNTLNEGVLQNPDWFTGRFGFIPTNTISHIMGAELQEKLYDTIEDFPQKVAKGDFAEMHTWLNDNIYSQGRKCGTFELMNSLVGKDISPQPLIDHLKRRYLSDKR